MPAEPICIVHSFVAPSAAAFLAGVAALIVTSGAFAATQDDPPVADPMESEALEQRSPCPELEGPTASRLDNIRTGVERSVCVTAWNVDRLFGARPEDELVASGATRGRLRAGVNWDERDGFDAELALNAQVQMPVARGRLLAVFGRDTDQGFVEGGSSEFDSLSFSEEDEERSWLLGIGVEPMRDERSRFGLSAGVRLRSPPDPFVQASYWYQSRFSERLLFRGRQTVFWENEDGFGTTTRLVLERGLGETRLLRWGNLLRLAESTEGMRWNTSLTLFDAWSARRAVALRGAVRGETGRDVNPIEYQALLIYRQRILREWLFLELRGGGGWIREELAEPREFVPQGAVVFEMAFGRP